MRTNHQLARLKAHSLGNIAIFGDSYENGIFSKINTFGNLGVSNAVKAQRAHNNNTTSLAAKRDSMPDNFIAPQSVEAAPGPSNLGSGPAHMAYFGSDPAFVRKEGGTMNSVTTFGNVEEDAEDHPSHLPAYFAGSGGTVLAILAGYFALKWTRRI
jgi:hypothetical protein